MRWARARLQVIFFCSWQMHQAEGPAAGQVAAPAQAATAPEDVGLNKGHKPGSSPKFPACTRPTAKIPVVAVSSYRRPCETPHAKLWYSGDLMQQPTLGICILRWKGMVGTMQHPATPFQPDPGAPVLPNPCAALGNRAGR